MPAQKRYSTGYAGVYFIWGTHRVTGKPEKIFYITYRKDNKLISEKAGRASEDMTPARASQKRALRMAGKEPTNAEKRAAEKAAKMAETEKWTIGKLWKEYKKGKPDLKGMVTDQNRFEKHIELLFGEKVPSDLVPLDIDRLRVKLQKNMAPGTVKNVLELLRRIINFGINKQLCEGTGFKIKMPAVNNIKTEDLNPEQLTKLLSAIDKDTNIQAANLMRMILFTGMRRSELFRLKWSDIDFDRGFIIIREPKGGVDQQIPLNETTRQILKKHPRHKKSPYVFPGRKGRQRTDIKHQVNRIKKAASLPANFRALHGLRHVYASMLASSGQVDLYTLQKLLTHKSPAMTQRYAHLRDDALKKASNLAGEIVTDLETKTKETAEKSDSKDIKGDRD